MTIAEITGLEVFPAGVFREWEYDPGRFGLSYTSDQLCQPDQIGYKVKDLCDKLCNALSQRSHNAIAIAAGVEWELGIGPIHPFYDACGRISRCFSLLTKLWMDEAPRLHASRDEYYRAACLGLRQFVTYYEQLPKWDTHALLAVAGNEAAGCRT